MAMLGLGLTALGLFVPLMMRISKNTREGAANTIEALLQLRSINGKVSTTEKRLDDHMTQDHRDKERIEDAVEALRLAQKP